MGHTLLCVLGLLLLNTPLYGRNKGVKAILESPDFTLFEGDSVILRCKHPTPRDEAKATFYKDRSPLKMDSNQQPAEMAINQVSMSDRGRYKCKFDEGAESESRELNVEGRRRQITLTADETIIPEGGHVKLTCSVENPTGWNYAWFGHTSDSSEKLSLQTENVNVPDRFVSAGGSYTCSGRRQEPDVVTPESVAVIIQEIVASKATVTLQPNWPLIYRSEKITLRCEIPGGGDTDWTYEWITPSPNTPTTHKEYIISSATESHSGEYRCRGSRGYTVTQWSDAKTLTVSERRRQVTLTADETTIPEIGHVKLTCSLENPTGWTYEWFRRTSEKPSLQTENVNEPDRVISEGGSYTCRGWRRESDVFTPDSNAVIIQETVPNTATVTIEPNRLQIYSSEKITLRCEIQRGGNTGWTYEWITPSPNTPTTRKEYIISSATESHGGEYRCRGSRGYTVTRWSDAKTLTVSVPNTATVTIEPNRLQIYSSEKITLGCEIQGGGNTGWTYEWITPSPNTPTTRKEYIISSATESHGGEYRCRGSRGYTVTRWSDAKTLTVSVAIKPTVTLQPNWLQIYSSEKIILGCEIQGGGNTGWTYEWRTPSPNTLTRKEYSISSATESQSGKYSCRGRRGYTSTRWSDAKRLTVSANQPKAVLSANKKDIPVGGSVTLTCSVNPSSSSSSSSGWKYFWYRGETSSKPLATQDDVLLLTRQISVSQGGLYRCRGWRGEPVYYTDYSDSIHITKNIAKEAVVTLHPNWSEIYKGETITLRCEVKDGGDTEWEYEWKTTSSDKPSKQNEHSIRDVSASHSGTYSCKGRMKSAERSSTDWSKAITLTVAENNPQPVLTVSSLWLSPGDSVTLNCSVQHPSAGWRFYWYKAVPKLSDNYYSYELLPGSTNGTEQGSYIVHGQTHTAGYVCRAGRGDPVFYTLYSKPKFAWSGDVHSSASLTVSPDRVQHFTSGSDSLNCDGNSTKWRVKRFTEQSYLYSCSYWGTMTGSTCNIGRIQSSDTSVYWCESGSGEFSNAVNITIQEQHIILASPVYPVTEGDSVSLSCKLRWSKFASDVFFYRNDELIQNDTRWELNISAVSKSDEGFYKCQYSRQVSPESWMSVKAGSRPEGSSFPVPVIIGLVCGILLLLLLLLLYRYRPSKDSCFIRPIRSESTDRGSATSHVVYQNEAEGNEYSSPLDDAADSQDVTYSLIVLKNIGKKRKQHEPEENVVYSDVRTETADNDLMYAQVNCRSKGKAKKNKRKSTPEATDQTVYSEIKPGPALGL